MPPDHAHSHAAATLPGLVAAGILDASLAALAWLLLDRGVPVLVAGRPAGARAAVADALADALPASRRPGVLPAGDRLVRLADALGPATPAGLLRAALGATTARSGLVATIEATDLAGVLSVLARQGLTGDESSFLGVVVVIGETSAGGMPRVTIAHYLRPVVRDAGGHPRRLGPAVLAAHDEASGRWEDFAWGIAPDLAERCRMRQGDFEMERGRRATLLGDLVARGAVDAMSFTRAISAAEVDTDPVRRD